MDRFYYSQTNKRSVHFRGANCLLWQPWIDKEDSNKQTSAKQLPTNKWKRERRRLPEYSRKSDPKLPECSELPQPPSSPEHQQRTCSNAELSPKHSDTPIDMSLRQRGLPPSYSQAIASPGYRTGFRPSVIISQAPSISPEPRVAARGDLPSGISMCDPIIDEHFRRSLGKDYLMLFNNNKDSEPVALQADSKATTPAEELLDMDPAGLSVDDHFAKALGDTWVKLNQKDTNGTTTTTTTTNGDKPTIVSL